MSPFLHSFIKDIPNDEDKARVKKFLVRIARHRKEFPPKNQVPKDVPGYENVISTVQNILDNALAEEGKKE